MCTCLYVYKLASIYSGVSSCVHGYMLVSIHADAVMCTCWRVYMLPRLHAGAGKHNCLPVHLQVLACVHADV